MKRPYKPRSNILVSSEYTHTEYIIPYIILECNKNFEINGRVKKIILAIFRKALDKEHGVVIYYIGGQENDGKRGYGNAGVAELADARDLKSRGSISRTGSSPVSGTKTQLNIAE